MKQCPGFMGLLLLAQMSMALPAGAEPIRMAGEARLFLVADASMPPLTNVACDFGRTGRAHWLKSKDAQDRMIDVQFPISWWRWTEVAIRFTPEADGVVELRLTGPWEERRKGQLWRQEVLWGEVGGTGATLKNGDFNQGISGWESPWGIYPQPGEWPVENQTVGASWNQRPLVQRFRVVANQPVELKVRARAAMPPHFKRPVALAGMTHAHKALETIRRGVNLSGGWEADPAMKWGKPYAKSDIDDIVAVGFDHIRVPVAWQFRMKNGKISEAFFAELDPVLRYALEKGLTVILDWHGFPELCGNGWFQKQKFFAGWKQISEHYRSWPKELWFELLNEPEGKLEGEVLNQLYARTIALIRRSHPQRIIVVNPGNWGSIQELDRLRLPPEDDRIVVSVHNYDPYEFTHHALPWRDLASLKGVVYPGPPKEPLVVPEALKTRWELVDWIEAYNTLPSPSNPSSVLGSRRLLRYATEWAKKFGRPVHLGEFGANENADLSSRKNYARAMMQAAEETGIPWCWWGWSGNFGAVEERGGKPVLLDVLLRKEF